MNNSTTSTSSSTSINYGRQRIILDYDEVTSENILEVLEKALELHESNKSDCEYLINYFLGEQDILNRAESETSNVNNKIVVNHAFPITREIVGYTLGNPIELTPITGAVRTDVDTVNKLYNYEEMYMTDTNTATYASICGLGYYITLPSTEITKDNTPDVPIVADTLDPRYTFVVQSSSMMNPQILSCHYIETEDNTIYTCYTDKYKFVVTDLETVETSSNPVGYNPITMEENSLFLTGDWEQAISVMNAENVVASDSINDIEGTIRSLLVILGAQFEDDDDTTLTDVKKNRLLTLANASGGNVDAKFISPALDSVSTENIREYLKDARNIITGIPDRDSTSTGGDTGTAVLNRNGWTDIEIVAKLKELAIKKAKKRQLQVAIAILKKLNLVADSLLVTDIDINIDRHRMDNLSARTTAFSTLVATGELATIDCLEMSGLTNRATEVVERGKEAKAERQQEAINNMINASQNTDTTATETTTTTETQTTSTTDENQ